MLNIDSLDSGIVIDHIKAGSSMEIYRYLRLDQLDCCVAIIKNAKSNKYGKKDIIKIEGITEINTDILGFIDHNITVNVIKDGVIVEKKAIGLPNEIHNVIKCKNPRCITSVEEGIEQVFRLSDRERHLYRCIYCEQEFKR